MGFAKMLKPILRAVFGTDVEYDNIDAETV